jgi:hypothetical protein
MQAVPMVSSSSLWIEWGEIGPLFVSNILSKAEVYSMKLTNEKGARR